MKLFVYGSLKPGGWSSHLLDGGVEDDPQEGSIRGSLYDNGSYPALKLDDVDNVYGLLYELKMPATDLMRRLDHLEGYPSLFDRTEVPVAVGNCVEFALVYFGNEESLFNAPRIESGVWAV